MTGGGLRDGWDQVGMDLMTQRLSLITEGGPGQDSENQQPEDQGSIIFRIKGLFSAQGHNTVLLAEWFSFWCCCLELSECALTEGEEVNWQVNFAIFFSSLALHVGVGWGGRAGAVPFVDSGPPDLLGKQLGEGTVGGQLIFEMCMGGRV